MVAEPSRILRNISLNLTDVEDADFNKEDVDVSDFSLVWLDSACAFNKLASLELAMCVEERDEYQKIKARFQAQKEKIFSLDLEYPEME